MTDSPMHRQAGAPRLAQLCAVTVGAVALLALVGWQLNALFFAGQWADYVPMAPSTALLFLLLGAALFCQARWPALQWSRVLALAAASLVVLSAGLVLAQFVAGFDLGLEQALSRTTEFLGAVPLGRMSPLTAVAFLLEGAGLVILLLALRRSYGPNVAGLCFAGAVFINVVVIIGYAYGAPLLYGGTIVPVALPTGVAFVVLGVGLMSLAAPHIGALRAWNRDSMRGRLARAFLPPALAIILVEGWLDLRARAYPSLNPALVDSLVALSAGILFVAITGWTARRVGDAVEAAQEQVRRLARFPDEDPDPVLRFASDGSLLYANAGSQRLLNIWQAGQPGQTMPEAERGLIAEVLAQGASHYREATYGETSYGLTLTPLPEWGYVNVYGRDITERKQAEERLRVQYRRLAALRAIDVAITGSLDLRLTLNVLLEQATAQLGMDAASVLLVNTHAYMLEFAAGRGFRTDALQHSHLRLGEGYAGRAALERQFICVPDLRARQTDFLRSPHFAAEGFVTYYAMPLIAKGLVNGVLELFHRAPHESSEEWRGFLETLAGQGAIVVDNARLFEGLQRANTELTLAYDATILGWSRALELRDQETEGHTQRVTAMTERLARAMGIGEAELVHIRRGALLHDIGKMGVPDSILLKPDKLTDEEWALMRRHPQVAFEMLAPIAYLRPALDIPGCHHEKWDGTGYPRGLKGEQIPLAARIFAVVDVWDALLSDRPYRRAWPEDKVLAHIREQAGKHFDPNVVATFLALDLSAPA